MANRQADISSKDCWSKTGIFYSTGKVQPGRACGRHCLARRSQVRRHAWSCVGLTCRAGLGAPHRAHTQRLHVGTHLAPPPPSTKAMALPVRTRARREKSECRSGGLWKTRWYIST